ncbi:MAG: hypothetical protein AAB933_01585 [Patescibacteria group bacterium]
MKISLKRERKFKKEEESWWLNMDIYWKLAVLLMFLGTVLAFFFGYRLFIEINKELVVFSNDANSQIETVKKETIEKTLQYFTEREKKSKEILNSPSPLIDPSL